MDLILVRHAQPERIDSDSGSGTSDPADPPLTAEGLEQAHRTAAWLAAESVEHIVSSPMRRARETAAPLAQRLGVEMETVHGITEFDERDASYIPFEEIPRDHEKFAAMVEGRWTDIDGWSDPDQFQREVVRSIEDLIARFPGRSVAVFAHAGVVNVYLGHVLGIDRPLWFYPGYASISRVAASREGARSVVSINETAHLQPERLRVAEVEEGVEDVPA